MAERIEFTLNENVNKTVNLSINQSISSLINVHKIRLRPHERSATSATAVDFLLICSLSYYHRMLCNVQQENFKLRLKTD